MFLKKWSLILIKQFLFLKNDFISFNLLLSNVFITLIFNGCAYENKDFKVYFTQIS